MKRKVLFILILLILTSCAKPVKTELIVPESMPKEAVEMFETFVMAISTGDRELYLTILPSDITEYEDDYYINYQTAHFEKHKNIKYMLREIITYAGNDEILRRGGYFCDIVVADKKGKLQTWYAIGITKDPFTSGWTIYDFD